MKEYEFGIRSVIAGGQRIQYTPESITGNSVMHYNKENPSNFAKKILSQTFVYHPAQF